MNNCRPGKYVSKKGFLQWEDKTLESITRGPVFLLAAKWFIPNVIAFDYVMRPEYPHPQGSNNDQTRLHVRISQHLKGAYNTSDFSWDIDGKILDARRHQFRFSENWLFHKGFVTVVLSDLGFIYVHLLGSKAGTHTLGIIKRLDVLGFGFATGLGAATEEVKDGTQMWSIEVVDDSGNVGMLRVASSGDNYNVLALVFTPDSFASCDLAGWLDNEYIQTEGDDRVQWVKLSTKSRGVGKHVGISDVLINMQT